MEKWEYLTATIGYQMQVDAKMKAINNSDLPDWKNIHLPQALALLGEDGWELVGVNNPGTGGADPILFFKRAWGGSRWDVNSFLARVQMMPAS